jgi:putative membrane-bound dehydrogenase-like protein
MSRGLRWSWAAAVLVWLGAGITFAADLATPASPLSPEESLQHLQVDPQCRVELVAAEPDVSAPVSMAFDEKGRLWVVEMGDYPNGPAPGEAPASRIRILADENGDGRFDKPQVFVDGLLFANSLLHWDGGVLVTTDGKLVYFKDTDGDGKADFREVWFEGFAIENPQLRCNHPTLGPDNWIYVANGLRNGKVKAVRPAWPREAPDSARLGEPVDIAGRDFRFNPFTGQCEAVSGYGQFGLTFDDEGHRYVCSNRNPCMKVLIEDRHLKLNPNLAVPSVYEDVSPAGANSKLYPISRTWTTSNLHEGQFSAACGLIIYRGTALPPAFYGQNFTCDPTGNLVHCDYWRLPADQRPREREFLASDETWFRPVNTALGSDGALYVVDMYRAVIEHPEYMPSELKTRPDLKAGAERGRIWRITSRSALPVKGGLPGFPSEPAAIARQIDSPNGWARDLAHRMIVERPLKSAEPVLREIVAQSQSPSGSAVALRALDGLGVLTAADLVGVLDRDVLQGTKASGKPAEGRLTAGRRTMTTLEALRLAEQFAARDEALARKLIEVGQLDLSAAARERLHQAFGALGDQFRDARIPVAVRDAGLDNPGIDRMIAATEAPSLTEIFLQLAATRTAGLLLEPTVRGAKNEDLPRILDRLLGENQRAAILRMDETLRPRGIALGSLVTGAPDVQQKWEAFGQSIAARVSEDMAGGRLDALTIQCLRFLKPEEAIPRLRGILNLETPPEITIAAVEVASAAPDPEAIDVLLTRFSQRTPAIRSAIITALLRTEPRIVKFLEMVEGNEISFIEIGAARLASLQQVKTPEIQRRVKTLIAANAPADRSQVLAEYQAALTHEHDPLRGRELFAKNCAQCHRIGDIGVEVAPNISDSRVKTQEQLLVDILDPNRAVDNNYFSYTLVEASGKVSTGIISSETSSSVTLKLPEGKTVTVLRSEIDELKPNGMSLMPVGFEKQLTVGQLADVISFVKNWRYLDGQVPREVIK